MFWLGSVLVAHLHVKIDTINAPSKHNVLTLDAPIATKVVNFSRLLKCLRSIYGKQCGP